eukprot:6750088-Prymnesium_polylepis.1
MCECECRIKTRGRRFVLLASHHFPSMPVDTRAQHPSTPYAHSPATATPAPPTPRPHTTHRHSPTR